MQPSETENPITKQYPASWFRAAVITAAAAAVFCAIVGVKLVTNNVQSKTGGLVHAEELSVLKAQLKANPRDEALKEQIRLLDYQLREEFFRRKAFSDRGAILLFGGVIVLVLSLRFAAACRRSPPLPTEPAETTQLREGLAMRSRWAVATIAVVFGTAALVLVTGSDPDVIPAALEAIEKAPKEVPKPPVKSAYPSPEEIRKNWPRFRGPGGLGISAYTNAPSSWNGKTGDGILWKAEVPLPGKSSPVVWSDRIFLTGAEKQNRAVYCFDTDSGKLLWQKPVNTAASSTEIPQEPMEDTGYAAPTAVTDGTRVYAMFANGDITGFDFQGSQVWATNLGVPENAYGHAASLSIWQDLVIVQYDQATAEDGKSRLLALKGPTGKIAWEEYREVPNSWASPIVIQHSKEHQIITSADPWVMANDPSSGALLWKANCISGDIGPSPVYSNGLVYATNVYAKVVAIRPDGIDDVTETHIAWEAEDGLPDMCSPLCDGKRLYLLAEGLFTCYNATTGDKIYEQDLDDMYHASPTLVGDKIYLLNDEGVMIIVKASDKFEEVGRAELGEICHASPAFLDGRIYIRSEKHLYCIGAK